jgi:hypothetical protein
MTDGGGGYYESREAAKRELEIENNADATELMIK